MVQLVCTVCSVMGDSQAISVFTCPWRGAKKKVDEGREIRCVHAQITALEKGKSPAPPLYAPAAVNGMQHCLVPGELATGLKKYGLDLKCKMRSRLILQ